MKDYKCPGCGANVALTVKELPAFRAPYLPRYAAYCRCRCGWQSSYGRGETKEAARKAGGRLAKRCAGRAAEKKGEKR